MTGAIDDEFRSLRIRAYGPDADIHLDPDALQRLQELEDKGRPPRSDVTPHPVPTPVEQPEPLAEEPGESATEHPARRLILWMRGVHRSTWVLLVAIASVVAIVTSALVLVQRVQTDPLQVGATQVARLSVDPGYEIPGFFRSMASEGREVQAFQVFHGLRTILTDGAMFGGVTDDECLNLYSDSVDVEADSNGFRGRIMVGCAAGPFPAAIQVRADDPEYPAELRSAFPGVTGYQLVYDSAHNEVVVFAGE